VLPGRRFAIVAGEPHASDLSREIELAGGEVVLSVPATSDGIFASGSDGVTSFTGDGMSHFVDVVVVAAGRLADAGFALMAECAAGYSAVFGGFVPKVDERMQTTVPGIFATGDCAGPCSPEIALAEGEYTGVCVAASLDRVSDAEVAASRARYLSIAPERPLALAAVSGSFVQIDRVPMGVGDR
jgi:pyruvate/2-oxoglutarate dehydrogenase complex dihydrolipoamide dehydrogenase (E3) component